MKIFIICCILFIHVNMCLYIRGFQITTRVSGIRRFGFGAEFTRNGFGFGFGFRLRVPVLGARRLHPIQTRPVAILKYYSIEIRVITCNEVRQHISSSPIHRPPQIYRPCSYQKVLRILHVCHYKSLQLS